MPCRPRLLAHLPADFIARHDLIRRLLLAPLQGLTPPRPWQPLSDAEWDAIAPMMRDMRCGMGPPERARAGRPLADPRGRIDAVFRAVTLKAADGNRAPWRALPEAFGKADTVSRSFRRWAKARLWWRLLEDLAQPNCPDALKPLAYWVCCAFRRAVRIMGLRAIVLARRLGFYSALPGPSAMLPDPDLSETCAPVFLMRAERLRASPGQTLDALFRNFREVFDLTRIACRLRGGVRRIPRALEPA